MIGFVTTEDLEAVHSDIRILGGEIANIDQKLDTLIKELKEERAKKKEE